MSSTRGLSILVVEDDPLLARAVVRALTHHGHDVQLTMTCADALKAPGPFDCAVLDIDLPDGDGLSLAHPLLESTARVVVFFSGSSDQSVRLAACDLGTFVPKSAGVDELCRAVLETVEEAAEGWLAAGAEDTPLELRNATSPRARTGKRRKKPL
jgi:DNA-binding response OmpR family regulator